MIGHLGGGIVPDAMLPPYAHVCTRPRFFLAEMPLHGMRQDERSLLLICVLPLSCYPAESGTLGFRTASAETISLTALWIRLRLTFLTPRRCSKSRQRTSLHGGCRGTLVCGGGGVHGRALILAESGERWACGAAELLRWTSTRRPWCAEVEIAYRLFVCSQRSLLSPVRYAVGSVCSCSWPCRVCCPASLCCAAASVTALLDGAHRSSIVCRRHCGRQLLSRWAALETMGCSRNDGLLSPPIS